MTHTGTRRVVFKEKALADRRVTVGRFQNRQPVSAVFFKQTGDTRRVVRCIRFKFAGAQRFLKGFALLERRIDRVGLVAVCNDGASVMIDTFRFYMQGL